MPCEQKIFSGQIPTWGGQGSMQESLPMCDLVGVLSPMDVLELCMCSDLTGDRKRKNVYRRSRGTYLICVLAQSVSVELLCCQHHKVMRNICWKRH